MRQRDTEALAFDDHEYVMGQVLFMQVGVGGNMPQYEFIKKASLPYQDKNLKLIGILSACSEHTKGLKFNCLGVC